MAIKAEHVATSRAAEARRREQAQYWVYLDGEIKRYGDARLGIMTHALNYGTGVFEGIRGNWNPEQNQLYLFRMRDHFERLLQSARTLRIVIDESVDELCDITLEVVRRSGFQEDVYIRPLAYKSSEEVGVRLHNLEDDLNIFVTPFGVIPPVISTFSRPSTSVTTSVGLW